MTEDLEAYSDLEARPKKRNTALIIVVVVLLVLLCCCCIFPLLFYFYLGDPLYDWLIQLWQGSIYLP